MSRRRSTDPSDQAPPPGSGSLAPAPVDNTAAVARAPAEQARHRLLLAALRLFSEQGFAKTSTREIARAADANVAAIRYYFGDKAGLYRAVYVEPLGRPRDDIPRYHPAHFSLRESLHGYFESFLEPMKQDALVQQCVRLHMREMLEPTGMWAQELEQGIKPAHAALIDVLRRHLALRQVDNELHRLAFAITALALQMFVCRDVIAAIRPQLIAGPAAVDASVRRLADYALALIEAESQRRLPPSPRPARKHA